MRFLTSAPLAVFLSLPDGCFYCFFFQSHKLQVSEVPWTVRAIARCGAGTNNVPVNEMTAAGIPVFNTPGANANAVKELVIAGLLLGSRDIIGGVNHMKTLGAAGTAREKVEKDKAMFGGREIAGKTVGIIGLGHIGSATARDCASLGMQVPYLTRRSCNFMLCCSLHPYVF